MLPQRRRVLGMLIASRLAPRVLGELQASDCSGIKAYWVDRCMSLTAGAQCPGKAAPLR